MEINVTCPCCDYRFRITIGFELDETYLDDPFIMKRKSYVYLIYAETGQYKIGRTTNPHSRLASLQSSSPVKLKLLWYTESKNARQLEKDLHREFAPNHALGEWFNLSDQDVELIKEIGYKRPEKV
jgi:hypothetical protein